MQVQNRFVNVKIIILTILSISIITLLYHIWGVNDRPSIWEIKDRLPFHRAKAPTEIPKKIWYKLGSQGLGDKAREWTDTCINKNPNYRVEFVRDQAADAYVVKEYADRPDIVETYMNLSVPILKADLFRYLVLYNEGGIWSDLDVTCEGPPIDEWIPEQYKEAAGMVVGWEYDCGYEPTFIRMFQTWWLMSKPRQPHMMMVIEDILEGVRNKTREHNVAVSELNMDMVENVIKFTGPKRVTDSVLKSLEITMGQPTPWEEISHLEQPKLLGDVLIMPGYAFALGSNGCQKDLDLGPQLVRHHYAGSWKNTKGGERRERRSPRHLGVARSPLGHGSAQDGE
ncbi:hypothetical protein EJ04DRAFT_571154 [Polyplosphaeria fusca]|uniref:Initiation-specific alpha-1,6-mannosyltransferase n=1 Tax=Polyplosphaeria fusca TaxID=682080 RepID=A0A9P4QKK4_9PLEO|nr:hypothetical protein EJ04DRAFT_571154 [Polyplosphaeria fusca]